MVVVSFTPSPFGENGLGETLAPVISSVLSRMNLSESSSATSQSILPLAILSIITAISYCPSGKLESLLLFKR